MTVYITLTTAGADTGPFNLYSDVDGYISAFETGVSKAALLAGYTSALAPNGTTIVRVMSDGTCKNYIDISVFPCPTTTTTTTCLCNNYEFVGIKGPTSAEFTFVECGDSVPISIIPGDIVVVYCVDNAYSIVQNGVGYYTKQECCTTTTTTTAAPVMYVYEAEERYCASCGLNSGNVTVFSYSPLTLFDFAVAATTPIPVVLTYKIISTSVNIPTVQVIPAGGTCLDACNYSPPE